MSVTEICPNCDKEVTMEWDTKQDGYKAFCPHCGKVLMLCDECMHAEDNHGCDWKSDFDGKEHCYRCK